MAEADTGANARDDYSDKQLEELFSAFDDVSASEALKASALAAIAGAVEAAGAEGAEVTAVPGGKVRSVRPRVRGQWLKITAAAASLVLVVTGGMAIHSTFEDQQTQLAEQSQMVIANGDTSSMKATLPTTSVPEEDKNRIEPKETLAALPTEKVANEPEADVVDSQTASVEPPVLTPAPAPAATSAQTPTHPNKSNKKKPAKKASWAVIKDMSDGQSASNKPAKPSKPTQPEPVDLRLPDPNEEDDFDFRTLPADDLASIVA